MLHAASPPLSGPVRQQEQTQNERCIFNGILQRQLLHSPRHRMPWLLTLLQRHQLGHLTLVTQTSLGSTQMGDHHATLCGACTQLQPNQTVLHLCCVDVCESVAKRDNEPKHLWSSRLIPVSAETASVDRIKNTQHCAAIHGCQLAQHVEVWPISHLYNVRITTWWPWWVQGQQGQPGQW